MEFLKGWVMIIVSMVMFITLVEMMLPSGKTKKVVNMVSGFILIITMINPVLELFGKTIEFRGFKFQDSNFLDRKEIEANSRVLNEKQMEQIIEVYRRNITERLRQLCETERGIVFINAEVQLVEDTASESFGELKRIYLDVAERKNMVDQDGKITPVDPIKKVMIGEAPSVEKSPVQNAGLINRMEELVQKAFGLSNDKIVINIVGK